MRTLRLCAVAALATLAAGIAGIAHAQAAGQPSSGASMVILNPDRWSKEDILTSVGYGWDFYPPGSGGKGPHISARPESLPPSMDLSALVARERRKVSGLKADRSAKICGGLQPGWFLEFVSSETGAALDTEEVIGLVSPWGYIATYSRYNGTPEDPKARKTLDSLCPQTN